MRRRGRTITALVLAAIITIGAPATAFAASKAPIFHDGHVDLRALLMAGGLIGYATIALSFAMVAMIIENAMSIRRNTVSPRFLAEELRKQVSAKQFQQADQLCRQNGSFLAEVVSSGLREGNQGYKAMEKAMEETAFELAARLSRKIEYLSVIGAVGPMLGLLGTVWGMIQAFAEFAAKANPSPADFAPSISEALVTTFFGLLVAIPAIVAFAWFRNRIDELTAEGVRQAEYVMSPLRAPQRQG